MTRARSAAVRDARPPERLVRAGNPLVRRVLCSPLGRAIGGLAVIEHVGRRTGTRRRVVVLWHELDGRGFALTPAPWRANFTQPAPARVTRRGRTSAMTGTLDADPARVARALRACLAAGASPRSFGLVVEPGHVIDDDDVRRVRRAVVWLDPSDA